MEFMVIAHTLMPWDKMYILINLIQITNTSIKRASNEKGAL
jgi:hypothetical protein